jgi:hypothetical protein
MHSWKTFKECLLGSWVEVAIFGMSSSLTGRRAIKSEAFIFVEGEACRLAVEALWLRVFCSLALWLVSEALWLRVFCAVAD